MTDNLENTPPPPLAVAGKPRHRSCLLYGCLTAAVMGLVTLLILFFSVNYAINKFVQQFTETAPMSLPKSTVTDDEFEQLMARMKVFKQALDTQSSAETLVLTANELNALIERQPELLGIRDKVAFSIEGNEIKGQISLPLDGFGVKRLQGRYLNGTATFKASLDNGVLMVNLQTLLVKGVTPPERFFAGIRSQNLAKDVYKDAKSAEQIKKLDRIEVKDGAIYITVRPK